MWRVWIEICSVLQVMKKNMSPSVWRVWIEIFKAGLYQIYGYVTLRVEGVD